MKIILIAGSLLWGLYTYVSAEEVAISTSAIMLQGRPGHVFEGSFYLSANPENEKEISLKGSLKTWFMIEENRDIALSSWIRMGPTDIILQPGAPQRIGYKITVPSDAQGFVMAMAVFETLPEKKITPNTEEIHEENINTAETSENNIPSKDTQEKRIIMYSVPVYLLIEGTINQQCSMVSLIFQHEQNSPLQKASCELENTGNVFIKPDALTLSIYDDTGKELMTLAQKAAFLSVFPKKRCVYELSGNYALLPDTSYEGRVKIITSYPDWKYEFTVPLRMTKEGLNAVMQTE